MSKKLCALALFSLMIFAGSFGVIADSSDAAEPVYKISYVADGVTYTFSEEEGNAILKTPTEVGIIIADGKAFVGWEIAGSDVIVAPGSIVTITDGVTLVLTAEVKLVDCTVTFMNGATKLSEVKYSYGDEIVVPTDPAKAGYTFDSWSPALPEADVDGKIYATSSVTYTAVFKEIYKVSWCVEGVTIASGDIAALNQPVDPAKDNYSFLGWAVNGALVDLDEYEFTGVTVFTAMFKADTYTVSFFDGDKLLLKETVSYGDKAIAPALPDGATGWDSDINAPIVGDKVFKAVLGEAPVVISPAPNALNETNTVAILVIILVVIAGGIALGIKFLKKSEKKKE